MILDPINPQSFCVEGSFFYVSGLTHKYTLNVDTVISLNDELFRGGFIEIFEIQPGEYFDSLSTEVIERLLHHMGIYGQSLPSLVDNCDMAAYPSIQFEIGTDSPLFDHSGTIVYAPDDYLESLGNGQCIFKIRASNNPRFGLNFLSKIATHFTRDRIEFCDPITPELSRVD
jgi:hypothetical protein